MVCAVVRFVVVAVLVASVAYAGPNTITYQGCVLKPDGSPVADGTYRMRFRIFDALTAGTQRWEEIDAAVPVTSGLFSTTLGDGTAFGSLFATYPNLWLEVAVDLDKNATFATNEVYSARQKMSGAAWAIEADTLDGKHAGDLGDITGVTAGVGLSGGGSGGNVSLAVQFAGTGSANSAARFDHNHNTAHWSLTGNAGLTTDTHFLGTTDGQALEFKVYGTRVMRFEYPSLSTFSPNIVAGSKANYVSQSYGSIWGATISGGGGMGTSANRVTDNYGTVSGGEGNQAGDDAGTGSDRQWATVGGGRLNTASGQFATVAGGYTNTASAAYTSIGGGESNAASGSHAVIGGGLQNKTQMDFATVGGGYRNVATNTYATVAGGSYSTASASGATVSGGYANHAAGLYATVAGGRDNAATLIYSFAAGHRARANHTGGFVWADSRNFDFASMANDQFNVRATGGVRIVSSIDGSGNPATGVQLNPGESAWGPLSTPSDRKLKENLAPVDGREILERLRAVPVHTWNYNYQEPSIRHIGPMAQDFYAAFGVGQDDKHIEPVDAGGVALVAIQGLYRMVQEKDEQIAAQQKRLSALEQKNLDQETRLAALEKVVAAVSRQRP
jgi:hypothetical protein